MNWRHGRPPNEPYYSLYFRLCQALFAFNSPRPDAGSRKSLDQNTVVIGATTSRMLLAAQLIFHYRGMNKPLADPARQSAKLSVAPAPVVKWRDSYDPLSFSLAQIRARYASHNPGGPSLHDGLR